MASIIKKVSKRDNSKNNLSFAERAAQSFQAQNSWQEYNGFSKFYKDIEKSLKGLAENIFPTNEYNQRAYEEAILASLAETISTEIGVKDFWAAIANAGCKELKIDNGHLSFYKNKKEKLDITPYTQAIIFEAHSSLSEQRALERKQKIEKAKQQLEELLEEINRERKRK